MYNVFHHKIFATATELHVNEINRAIKHLAMYTVENTEQHMTFWLNAHLLCNHSAAETNSSDKYLAFTKHSTKTYLQINVPSGTHKIFTKIGYTRIKNATPKLKMLLGNRLKSTQLSLRSFQIKKERDTDAITKSVNR
jgi:hypothetical protein